MRQYFFARIQLRQGFLASIPVHVHQHAPRAQVTVLFKLAGQVFQRVLVHAVVNEQLIRIQAQIPTIVAVPRHHIMHPGPLARHREHIPANIQIHVCLGGEKIPGSVGGVVIYKGKTLDSQLPVVFQKARKAPVFVAGNAQQSDARVIRSKLQGKRLKSGVFPYPQGLAAMFFHWITPSPSSADGPGLLGIFQRLFCRL